MLYWIIGAVLAIVDLTAVATASANPMQPLPTPNLTQLVGRTVGQSAARFQEDKHRAFCIIFHHHASWILDLEDVLDYGQLGWNLDLVFLRSVLEGSRTHYVLHPN